MEVITNKQVKEFLQDYQENAEIEILEAGSKEETDLLEIAKKKGYNLKDNTDLGGIKCIYAFTDKPNKNGAILPEKPFLKALPSIIGKPINIGHNRKMIIGHIIDYSYQQKTKKAITYGVVYKDVFEEEWEQAQKDLKAKKLNVSFEIWTPKKDKKYLADGTYELRRQEMAGMALLFRDDEPAFDGAKVLSLAKKMKETNLELVFASTHKDDELIIADDEKSTQTIMPVLQKMKIKCSNCSGDFEAFEASEIQCLSCKAIVNKEGNMLYPPQIKDFQVMCPGCKSSHWKILSRNKEGAKIKCLNESICGKAFGITWAKEKTKSENPTLAYLYEGNINCLQCGKVNKVLGTSNVTKKEVKCTRCGLTFDYDIKGEKTYKKISKIEGIDISTTSEKGGNPMKDVKKEHDFLESSEKENKEAISEQIEKAKVEAEKVEPVEKVEPKKEDNVIDEPTEKEQLEVKDKVEEAPKAEEAKVDIYPKSKALRKALKRIKDLEQNLTTAKVEQDEALKNGIKKVAKQLIESKKQVELYKTNAKEILTRRNEVGDYEISDEDILNDDKYDKAKLELENARLKADNENSNDIVGVKEQGSDYYGKIRKQIDKKAFGRKDQE